jgi:hypothetical protein
VLLREGLPVEIEGPGLPGLARAFAASVLVDDDAPQRFDAFGNPDGVLHGKDQFTRLCRGLVADSLVGRFHRRCLIVGSDLGKGERGEECQEDENRAHFEKGSFEN